MDPLTEESFIRFIVLILPGLWALWVYKPFVLSSSEETAWGKELALAMSFGLPGYLIILAFPNIAKWPIAAQVILSSVIAILAAIIMGKLHRKGMHPAQKFAKWDSKKSGYPEDVPYNRGVPFIFGNLILEEELKKGRTAVALVYRLGDREHAMIGNVLFIGDCRHNEVVLDMRPEIELQQIDKNHWDIYPWVRSINLDSGIVVEIANIEDSVIDIFKKDYDLLKAKEYELDAKDEG
jgi:hypothetical protein